MRNCHERPSESSKVVNFVTNESPYATSYLSIIVTIALSHNVWEIQQHMSKITELLHPMPIIASLWWYLKAMRITLSAHKTNPRATFMPLIVWHGVIFTWRCTWSLQALSVCQFSFPYNGWFLLYACWRRRTRRWRRNDPSHPYIPVLSDFKANNIRVFFCHALRG